MKKLALFILSVLVVLTAWFVVRAALDYRDARELTRQASRTLGWVTGVDEGDRTIFYAYRVTSQVFPGHYQLGRFDSDLELTHPGDSVNVIYSLRKPSVSLAGDNPASLVLDLENLLLIRSCLFTLVMSALVVLAMSGRRRDQIKTETMRAKPASG